MLMIRVVVCEIERRMRVRSNRTHRQTIILTIELLQSGNIACTLTTSFASMRSSNAAAVVGERRQRRWLRTRIIRLRQLFLQTLILERQCIISL